jgi:hypothetical protein
MCLRALPQHRSRFTYSKCRTNFSSRCCTRRGCAACAWHAPDTVAGPGPHDWSIASAQRPGLASAHGRAVARSAGEKPHVFRHGPGAAACSRAASGSKTSLRPSHRIVAGLFPSVLRRCIPRSVPEADGKGMWDESRTCFPELEANRHSRGASSWGSWLFLRLLAHFQEGADWQS